MAVKLDCLKCDFERVLREEDTAKYDSKVTGLSTIHSLARDLVLDHKTHDHPDDPHVEVQRKSGRWNEWSQEFIPTENSTGPEDSVHD